MSWNEPGKLVVLIDDTMSSSASSICLFGLQQLNTMQAVISLLLGSDKSVDLLQAKRATFRAGSTHQTHSQDRKILAREVHAWLPVGACLRTQSNAT
jgi:hypothetical protein